MRSHVNKSGSWSKHPIYGPPSVVKSMHSATQQRSLMDWCGLTTICHFQCKSQTRLRLITFHSKRTHARTHGNTNPHTHVHPYEISKLKMWCSALPQDDESGGACVSRRSSINIAPTRSPVVVKTKASSIIMNSLITSTTSFPSWKQIIIFSPILWPCA